KALDKYIPSPKVPPSLLHKAMRYSVFPGGKRIRAVLAIASFEACGGKDNSILPVASAIELIHNYTLVHDDLPCMDNDDYRRGKLSCHKKFNEWAALLAGDALLTLGFKLLSESGNINTIRDISEAAGSCGVIGGQVADIKKTRGNAKIDKKALDYITSHKTGFLFEAAMKAGGIFKGVNKKKIQSLGNFGRHIGFTFQLIDDLIDGDGYVKIYGADHLKKMARLLTERAKAELKEFGKKADRLSAIADLIVERKA
ncbi:polyprenyl synthetase family protein, partial [Candidatus Omnitrophota bacterium]